MSKYTYIEKSRKINCAGQEYSVKIQKLTIVMDDIQRVLDGLARSVKARHQAQEAEELTDNSHACAEPRKLKEDILKRE